MAKRIFLAPGHGWHLSFPRTLIFSQLRGGQWRKINEAITLKFVSRNRSFGQRVVEQEVREHQRDYGEYRHDRQVNYHDDDERDGGPHRLAVAHPRHLRRDEQVQRHGRDNAHEAHVGAEEDPPVDPDPAGRCCAGPKGGGSSMTRSFTSTVVAKIYVFCALFLRRRSERVQKSMLPPFSWRAASSRRVLIILMKS